MLSRITLGLKPKPYALAKRKVAKPYRFSKVVIPKRNIFEFLKDENNEPIKRQQVLKQKGLFEPTPALDYISQVPPVIIKGDTAACDGGEGPLGHPKIYMNTSYSSIDDPAVCGYCGLKYVKMDAVVKELEEGRELKQGKDFILASDLVKILK